MVFLAFQILVTLTAFHSSPAQNTFLEINGIVSMEAEHYTGNTGPWEQVEGRNAVSVDDAGLGNIKDAFVRILKSDHPLAAGFAGKVTLTRDQAPMNWGFPNENATVIAVSQREPEKAVIFAYENGAKMPGLPAPEKRVALFIRNPEVTLDGWAMFDAAVKWVNDSTFNANRDVLFLTNSEHLSEMDSAFKARLERLDCRVIIGDDNQVKTGDADGKTFILISESVASNAIGTKFRSVTIPVIVCEPYLFDDMGMIIQRPAWKESAGQFGNAMMIRWGKWSDNLRYSIFFSNPGSYSLWLMGKNGGDSGTDDVAIFLDPDSIRENLLHYNIRFQKDLGWTRQMHFKTPGNPEAPGKASIEVKKAGWHTLYLVKGAEPEHPDTPPEARKYPNWRVDKIIISRDETPPLGDGPLETTNNQQVKVPDSLLQNTEFFPSQVWLENENYVVVEAEAIDHHSYWKLSSKPWGYSGNGYLQWRGPDRTRSIEGLGGNDDELCVRQGPQEEWIILRLFVTHPGNYRVNVRNYHLNKDDDNDAWIAKVGFRPNRIKGTKITRIGDSHQDGNGFTWLDWGVHKFWFKKGINDLYISGRSVGFGIDRITVYKDGDPIAKKKALNLKTPVSKLKMELQ